MKRLVLAAVLIALVRNSFPAFAITDGAPDGGAHPYVGLMVAQDTFGHPLWRCSGTLLSPTLYITAGHCASQPATHAEIWFSADVESGIPGNGYPYHGDVGGRPVTHPAYDPARFYYRDVGLVILDPPYPMPTYGVLPTRDQLDALRAGNHTRFTAVGYGLQQAFPTAAAWKESALLVRMVAEPYLVQINTGFTGDFSLLLSNNAHSGGTCFGDSGGPDFIGGTNVIAGITSYGLNGTCAGTGGVYRLDRTWNLDWLANLAP